MLPESSDVTVPPEAIDGAAKAQCRHRSPSAADTRFLYADLHIHSKYSRACSRDCDLEHLAWWAARKGIALVGTGDFTHPAWGGELRTKLVPAEPGLFRLRNDVERDVSRTLPSTCATDTRFMLSVEISTIYKRAERTRKVHHLIYVPDFDAADRVAAALGKIGNLASDGRPILGLDSRDLLDITLESGPGSYLVPAHAWTPWFSVLGSKSGFDAVEECYADLAEHIFAIETGLSSDPPMNWRVSGLDGYRLVSNSDAHSPPMLGREASVFATDLDYFAIRRALETGDGYLGTAEFFPEEGKYHLDGHRKCGIRFEPYETRRHDGRCPGCGRPLTVGVLHRVEELADREEGARPDGAAGYRNLVPLPEIVGEILQVGPKSKKVAGTVAELVARLGPELDILTAVPVDEIEKVGGCLLGEAVARLRRGAVVREAGYDGEYGVIRLFTPEELRGASGAPALFDVARAARPRRRASEHADHTDGTAGQAVRRSAGRRDGHAAPPPAPGQAPHAGEGQDPAGDPAVSAPAVSAPAVSARGGLLGGLDPDQYAAAAAPGGPLLIVAGPGTGKTRTLTHRIAHLVVERGVPAEQCLAITFTRRACGEMRERLTSLAPDDADRITVTTFHAFGLQVLREQHERVGLPAAFRIADDADRLAAAHAVAEGRAPATDRTARRVLADLDEQPELRERYRRELRARDLVDLDDLVALPADLLGTDPDLAAHYRDRFPWVFVDEYQDVDERQYRLLRLLSGPEGYLTVIGDPDQAIYAFRGGDVAFFLRFRQDHPSARVVQLTRNYRSSQVIVRAALQAIGPGSLVPGRALTAVEPDGERIVVHQAADEYAEASFVAREVDRLLGGSSFHSLDSGRVDTDGAAGLSFSDIAILYRTDAQARPVMAALTEAGIPFQKRSHDRLADRPYVREIVAELPYHAGPLPERLRSAGAAVLDRLPPDDRPGDPGVQVAVRTAVELLLPLARRCEAGDAVAVTDAGATTAERGARPGGTDDEAASALERFAGELALGAEVDTWDPRADRVSLLTMHAAKGLEFRVVFLVGCEEGLLPLRFPGEPDRGLGGNPGRAGAVPERNAAGDPGGGRAGAGEVLGERAPEDTSGDIDEERRLFFVGITRARSHLYLSHALRRQRYGQQSRDCPPSRFLSALDHSLLERATEATRRRPRDRQLTLL